MVPRCLARDQTSRLYASDSTASDSGGSNPSRIAINPSARSIGSVVARTSASKSRRSLAAWPGSRCRSSATTVVARTDTSLIDCMASSASAVRPAAAAAICNDRQHEVALPGSWHVAGSVRQLGHSPVVDQAIDQFPERRATQACILDLSGQKRCSRPPPRFGQANGENRQGVVPRSAGCLSRRPQKHREGPARGLPRLEYSQV